MDYFGVYVALLHHESLVIVSLMAMNKPCGHLTQFLVSSRNAPPHCYNNHF